MGGRIWNKAAKQANREAVEVCGKFWTNNTSSPAAKTGNWFTVARTAAGLHTVTLAAGINPPVNVGALCSMGKAAGADMEVEFYLDWDASARTFGLRLATGAGVDTDLAADADNWVSFAMKFALNADY